MKFSISLNEFQSVIARALPAIPPKSTLPILEHFHCTVSTGKLTLVATDQELTISASTDINGGDDGSILIPARKLNEIIKALGSEGSIDISVNANFSLSLNTPFGKYSMNGMSADEFPNMPHFPEGVTVNFKQDDIQLIANKTSFAVSKDEYRPAMTGVLFQFRTTEVRTAATDSYRLSRVIIKNDAGDFPADLDLIIPSRTIDLLKKVDSDVMVSVTKTHAQFIFSNATIVTRVIDERFPPYENVIPVDNDKNISINPKDMLSAVKRVSIFTSDTSHQVRLKVENNTLTISGADDDTGSKASETVICDYTGDTFEIGFNYVYIIEALQHLLTDDTQAEVTLSCSTPTRAALIKPTGNDATLLMLVMPVRL
ncbi:MAG: DNA polymerase III subunit beta [Bacteroidetes bacterium]|nr:DNA polymerase III subunit beta [Bacteroidota bacterium]